MLQSGFPPTLNYGYAVLVATNSASCIATIWLGHRNSAFFEVLVDSVYVHRLSAFRTCSGLVVSWNDNAEYSCSFDLLVAVVFPIMVLAYCYSNFDLDREALILNLSIFPVGNFERQAWLMANPSEISLFRTSFDSLRILTPTDFCLRVGINLSFCNRLKRVVEVQVARSKRAVVHSRPQAFSQTRQALVPRYVAILFGIFSALVIVLTHASMTASVSACAAFPECVVYAHKMFIGDVCPCITLIDVDKAPKSYEEWANPVDKTNVVKLLARAGDLQVLQLINRRLLKLPIELQRCTYLKHMYDLALLPV